MQALHNTLCGTIMFALLFSGPAGADEPKKAAGGEMAQVKAVVKNIVQDNSRFVKAHDQGYFKPPIKGQHPRATLVTCSDSRMHFQAYDLTRLWCPNSS